jgi:hypothetical protein
VPQKNAKGDGCENLEIKLRVEWSSSAADTGCLLTLSHLSLLPLAAELAKTDL